MIWLRALLFNIVLFAGTAIAFVGWLPLLALHRRHMNAAARAWTRILFGSLRVLVGLDWELRGDASLLAGAALVACKHQSAWETFVFFLIAADPVYVVKSELLGVPLYGRYVRHQDQIVVDREAGAAAIRHLVAEAERVLADGRQVIIFPEGTRTAPGAPPAYQPGIAALYRQLGRPVVPLALNSGTFWPRRGFIKRPGRIVIEILPPIPAGLPRAAFMRRLERDIEAATARLEGRG